MSHMVVQSFDELQVGARIRVRGWEYDVEIVGKSPGKWLEVRGNGPANTISYTRYLCTLLNSPGYRKNHDESKISEAELHWMQCEQHYGIDHHGEETPCPLRELAFKILKGDPQALDAARDILRC